MRAQLCGSSFCYLPRSRVFLLSDVSFRRAAVNVNSGFVARRQSQPISMNFAAAFRAMKGQPKAALIVDVRLMEPEADCGRRQ
jgi:hypothetical protein